MKIIFVLLMITSISVDAKEEDPWYVSGVLGPIESHKTGEKAFNIGMDIGYRHNGSLSTEVQLTGTVFSEDEQQSAPGNDWRVNTFSVFSAFRTNTQLKLKAKVGLTHMDRSGVGDTELSYGVGIGTEYDSWYKGPSMVEIEYTILGDRLAFVGLRFFTGF